MVTGAYMDKGQERGGMNGEEGRNEWRRGRKEWDIHITTYQQMKVLLSTKV